MKRTCERIELLGGGTMPSVGLGLWKIDRSRTADIVEQAIKLGYRHIDAACDYGNESEAGEGISRSLEKGHCTRDELWVTSKLWNTYHRPEHVRIAAERSLHDLRLDYLDLYLIHFPITLRFVPLEERYPPGWIFDPSSANPKMEIDSVPIAETWGAMEELLQSGLVKHIGVSNFGTSLIRDLLSTASIRPSVLQVESHPYLTQEKLLKYCQEEAIAYTAFSPLGAGSYVSLGMATEGENVLLHPSIQAIASRHSRTPAQIVLRWGVQRGTAVIPKASQLVHLEENIALFDFDLTSEEMTQISQLNRHHRFNDPGVFCEKAFGRFYPIFD